MTMSMLTRELIVVSRRAALAGAIAVYVGVLAGFTLVWGLKLPVLTGAGFFEALRTFHWGLLAIVLPWVAARCQAQDYGDGLVRLSALVAQRPSAVVAAKILALAAVLALVAVAGIPAVIIAEKMSALPLSAGLHSLGSALAVALLVSAVTTAWIVGTGDAMLSWIGGTTTSAVVLAAAARWTTPAVRELSIVLIAIAVAAALAAWSDRAFQYCNE